MRLFGLSRFDWAAFSQGVATTMKIHKHNLVALLCALLSVAMGSGNVQAQQFDSYFLLDKSGSMADSRSRWDKSIRKGGAEDVTLLESAVQRIESVLEYQPPEPGVRDVYILTFDTDLKDEFKPASLEEAHDYLHQINAEGRTVIGEQLHKVSKMIQSRDRITYVYLFTDMEEFPPDGYTPDPDRDGGIEKLDAVMQEKLRNKEGALYQFTWGDTDIYAMPGARVLSMYSPPIVPVLTEISPAVSFEVVESGHRFTGTKSQKVTIEGKITPDQEILKKLSPFVQVSTQNYGPLLLNGKEKLPLPLDELSREGDFVLKNISLEFSDLDRVFGKDRNVVPKGEHELTATIAFENAPDSTPGLQGIVLFEPVPAKTTFQFGTDPVLRIANWNEDEVMELNGTVGQPIAIPLHLKWNLQTAGKKVSISLHDLPTDAAIRKKGDGPVAIPLTLGSSGELELEIFLKEAKTAQGVIDIQLDNAPTQKRRVKLNIVETRIDIAGMEEATGHFLLTCDPVLIMNDDGTPFEIVLSSYPIGKAFDARIRAQVPPGLELELVNSYDHSVAYPLGQGYRSIEVTSHKTSYYLQARAERGGVFPVTINLEPESPHVTLKTPDGTGSASFSKSVSITAVHSQWTISGRNKRESVTFGTPDSKPLLFLSNGSPATTTEAQFGNRKDPVTLIVSPSPRYIFQYPITIYARYESDADDEKKQFLDSVLFEASGKNSITLDQFIRNPSFQLLLKPGERPNALGFKREESGRVILGPAENPKAKKDCDPLSFIEIPVQVRLQKK